MEQFKSSLPNVDSNIRFLHAVAKAPAVDVYVNGTLLSSNLNFGKISDYTKLTPGEYELLIYKAGIYDTPLLSETVQLYPKSNYTICITTLSNDLYFFKLKDDNIPSKTTQSFLRFINLSPNSPLLSLNLTNNTTLFSGAEYLETTGYYQLSSGIYNFKVVSAYSDQLSKFIKNLTLDDGKFYTIYIIGLFNDKPPIGYLFVEDKS